MYIVTGLGQIFKPRPKVTPKLPPKARRSPHQRRDGSRRTVIAGFVVWRTTAPCLAISF
jgi:hypothetical protein